MKQEIQQKYIELQILNQQIKKVQEQFMLLQQQLAELTSLETSLIEMNDIKKDSEIFSSIGSGIFVNSKLADPGNVMVNVGAGILVTKTVEEAIKLVKVQVENVNKSQEAVKEELTKAATYSEQLTQELNELVEKDQQK
ncbi:MAG: prefoldin subunit alpha [Nanoarchaeota archaeon]